MIDVAVHATGLWSPEHRGVEAWRADHRAPAPPRDDRLGAGRRRATFLSRVVADLAEQVGADDLALVMGSAGGEYEQTFATLPLQFEAPPASSPLRFGASVHNAAVGQLSIAIGNRQFASALSVRPEDLAAIVLLEAALLGRPVAVLWAEETWPGADWPPLGAALRLGGPGPPLGRLTDLRRGASTPRPDPRAGGSPVAHAVDLVAGLTGEAVTLPLGGGWEVRWTPA